MPDTFEFHDLETAPEASKELLGKLYAETGRNEILCRFGRLS